MGIDKLLDKVGMWKSVLADVMISQDKSEWQETLFHYQVMGFSEDEAFLAA